MIQKYHFSLHVNSREVRKIVTANTCTMVWSPSFFIRLCHIFFPNAQYQPRQLERITNSQL